MCNAITVRKSVLSPIGVSDKTRYSYSFLILSVYILVFRSTLAERGFKVVEIDMSEFMKSGGACQCLVLRL